MTFEYLTVCIISPWYMSPMFALYFCTPWKHWHFGWPINISFLWVIQLIYFIILNNLQQSLGKVISHSALIFSHDGAMIICCFLIFSMFLGPNCIKCFMLMLWCSKIIIFLNSWLSNCREDVSHLPMNTSVVFLYNYVALSLSSLSCISTMHIYSGSWF